MSFGSDAGGIEKSLIEFLKFLQEEGCNVDLFLWRKPGILFDKIPDGINIINFQLYPGKLNLRKGIKEFLWYIRFRINTLQKHPVKCFRDFPVKNYDVAISYCQNGYSPYYVIDKVQAKKKIMFYHHGSYESEKKVKRIDEQYYLKYDAFVTVSNANKEMLIKHFPSMKNKISVIRNLCDEENIRNLARISCPIDRSGVDLIFCTVGRIAPEKGQVLSVEVARQIKAMGHSFRWYFVGDGPDREKCNELVEKYDLTQNCIFTGVQVNPYPYINNCDIYIQTSLVEAEPVTIREAKVLNKVIITTDIPAMREALNNYAKGLVVPAIPDLLASAICDEICLKTLGSNSDNINTISENDQIKVKIRNLLKC